MQQGSWQSHIGTDHLGMTDDKPDKTFTGLLSCWPPDAMPLLTSQSFSRLSVDAEISLEPSIQRTYDTAFLWPLITARGTCSQCTCR